jgi:Ca-activated chloride channel family protein
MNLEKNDPKLTAYALNELPETERQAVEKELAANPEAQKTVDEIRALAGQLNAHYAEEGNLCLTDAQREAIFAAARKKKANIIPFPRHVWVPLVVAASFGGIFLMLSPTLVVYNLAPQKSMCYVPLQCARPACYVQVSEPGLIDEISPAAQGPSIEDYAEIRENKFLRVADQPLSTFSIDVDTASYSNMRRFLQNGTLPPKDAVRIEELINYFTYDYEPPRDGSPFATSMEASICPWNPQHTLVRIGLKGRVMEQAARPALNLVFLLDVSGSMDTPNKLPLVQRAMTMLTQQLDERDRVSIVVYAGASGLVLPPTSGRDKQAIIDALNRLEAGGGTNGGEGIELAYKTALENYKTTGVNRVILCTDGDFNIGVTQGGDLNRLIEEKAKGGVFLSVLGFGMGNYKDGTLEQLADRGNGNYAYIDTFSEARKVLVDQMSGTLVTIAKDVKIQVEFNPARVAGYRLIGYENRMLAAEDFNDDKKDAGEIGAGHTVTALYEIVPAGQAVGEAPPVDELKYQTADRSTTRSDELLTLKLRYKQPDSDTSSKLEFPLTDPGSTFQKASPDFRFAASVAGFGMLLRDSEYKGDLTYEQVLAWANAAQGKDEFNYRREFIDLIRNAAALDR